MTVPGSREAFRTLDELHDRARERMDARITGYVDGGSGEGRTIEANLSAFHHWRLRPNVLTGLETVDLRCRVLGRELATPFFVAPMAYLAQVHPDGELGLAQAASDRGILAAFSTLSSASIEGIAAASAESPRWFQLYLQPEFSASQELVERAERAGYDAIVLTADVPVLGVRDRQAAGGFAIDATVPVGNGPRVVPPARAPERDGSVYRLRRDSRSDWRAIKEVRSITRLPVVVKGILTAADAHRSVSAGARGIVVSNHGGRQLDGCRPSLDALEEVVAEVSPQIEVYLDSGVRRAADILVAVSLGARAVGIGRPVAWGLAVDGARGVGRYFDLLAEELAVSMALCGRGSIAEIDRSLCERAGVSAAPAAPGAASRRGQARRPSRRD